MSEVKKHELAWKGQILSGQTPPDDLEEVATITLTVNKVTPADGDKEPTREPVASLDFGVNLSPDSMGYWIKAHDGSWWHLPVVGMIDVAIHQIVRMINEGQPQNPHADLPVQP